MIQNARRKSRRATGRFRGRRPLRPIDAGAEALRRDPFVPSLSRRPVEGLEAGSLAKVREDTEGGGDTEAADIDHEAALLVLSTASELVEGGFTEGWGGYGLDAPSIARRLAISTRALAKRHRLAVLVCHEEVCLASRGFSDPAQWLGVSDALAGNASVVLSMAQLTEVDARARGLTKTTTGRGMYASLVQRRAYRGARVPRAWFGVSRRRRSTVCWHRDIS